MGGSPFRLTEAEVLLTAAGRDMDDAGAFRFADRLPGDDAMRLAGRLLPTPSPGAWRPPPPRRISRRILLSRQFVERAVIGPTDHLGAGDFALDLEAAAAS